MNPDEIQIASAYVLPDRVILHAQGRTTAGAWIPSGPLRRLPPEPLAGVAEDLLRALGESRQGLPHPPDLAAVMAPLLEASGARKWPDFLKVARCLGVERRGEALRVVPTRNLGEEGGFEPLVPEAVPVDRPEAAALARALGSALAQCR